MVPLQPGLRQLFLHGGLRHWAQSLFPSRGTQGVCHLGEQAMLPGQQTVQRLSEVTGWAEAVANLRLPSKPCITLSRYTAPRNGSP